MVERVAIGERNPSDRPIPHHVTPLLANLSIGEVLQVALFEVGVRRVSLNCDLTGRFDELTSPSKPVF